MRILDLLFPPREDERIIREVSLDAFCARMSPHTIPGVRGAAIGLTLYSDAVVRAAIHEAKYHGSTHAFGALATLLADFLQEFCADTIGGEAPVVLLPVPLAPARRRERGYNQVEEVATRAVRLMRNDRITIDSTLMVRRRETLTQVSLKRSEREANMHGAFIAMRALERGTRYIVLDDVLTTGATLGAALDALLANGARAEQLVPLALAYQP